MRLTTVLLMASMLQVNASGFAQKINLSKTNVPLKTIIKHLRLQSGYDFVYNNKILAHTKPLSVNFENIGFIEALDQVFGSQSLTYTLEDKIVVVRLKQPAAIVRSSDTFSSINIRGKVVDDNGKPLPGITVKVKGTNTGTITDGIGEFVINVTEKNSILIFSATGFKIKEVETAGKNSINVVMFEDISVLSQVVITGYGAQSRETLTTSISKLDDRVLENVPYANATSALQGNIAGLTVKTSSGQPGASPKVVLRGGISIANPDGANPLYSIDGVIRDNMNDINPEDIASIQVLKDAAATSIYGARGSNGVILVTTKSGKAGASKISYSYDLTSSHLIRDYEFLNARDYIYFARLGILATARKIPARVSLLSVAGSGGTGNDLTNSTLYTTQYLTAQNQHKLSEGWESMVDPVDPSKTIIFKDTDFQEALYRTGIAHNHYITASGGTDKATFNAGLGYNSTDGIAITTKFRRLSVNMNGNLQLKDNVSVFGRLLYTNTGNNAVNSESIQFGRNTLLPRTAKFIFEDGSIAPGRSEDLANPVYQLGTFVNKNAQNFTTIVLGSKWAILPGLVFEPQVSYYNIQNDARSFRKAFLAGVNLNTTRSTTGDYAKQTQTQADAVLTYNKSFKNLHNFEIKGGFSFFGKETATIGATGQGASTDVVPTLNSAAIATAVRGQEAEQVIIGYFSRVNYNYNSKYLLSFNARYDGASNLGDNYKFGFFPGVSLGWNVHKENFWTSVPAAISSLKLRSSYGVNGNINGLGLYQAQGQYSVGLQYGGLAGIQNSTIANNELKWEQSKTLDVGLDLGLLNNRISLLFDYYIRRTDNLLTSFSLPQSTGFQSVLTNLGSLQNRGFELELTASPLPVDAAFQWSVSFNAAKVKNKILKLPDNGVENNRIGGFYVYDPARQDYAWLGGLQEGGRIGDYYAYKQASIYRTDAEAAAGPVDMLVVGTDKTKYGGDVNWEDVDGNGIIDERDRVYLGNQFPTLTGGFSNYFTYKNISLSVRMDYTAGHTIVNGVRLFGIQQASGDNGLSIDVLRSWQNPGDVTDIPKYYYADQQAQRNVERGNSQFYEKGDYIALREVTLSYSLPQSVLRKIKLNNLRFNITGNNLHYFTKFKGMIPEDGGLDVGRYPVARNFIFGVNISI
ncbi:SusC/RagA family TonB-linked outer membrane protein [Pedobacter heparinus]|uniref:TonB-dependent receptor plug n=1 Tax=Pedobacter heparinus (strain ATCC 13125 / DSM 2366 / CIP 104194 / JCM 7457 / NBRC 12017 / NCIMB 9290 / NRRL B-14731 / HIM 762-3) TaxID=485917 RepID=C6Y0D4_PEDHD|nr:TonB-dependent receptor [Pedobacter heparinus]ACU04846.1 TonB-dependent receptor plug [Pedobacter heparinus DSM 2366]